MCDEKISLQSTFLSCDCLIRWSASTHQRPKNEKGLYHRVASEIIRPFRTIGQKTIPSFMAPTGQAQKKKLCTAVRSKSGDKIHAGLLRLASFLLHFYNNHPKHRHFSSLLHHSIATEPPSTVHPQPNQTLRRLLLRKIRTSNRPAQSAAPNIRTNDN